jgi:hypothetical protein
LRSPISTGRTKAPVEYHVETVSLGDLLAQHKAPGQIDYLSIDTEGSELTILRALDFDRWRFHIITVEHNWVQSARDGIHSLLTSHRYVRVLPECSLWDDWYINRDSRVASPGRSPPDILGQKKEFAKINVEETDQRCDERRSIEICG